jgi:hypothetical protein
MAGSVATVKFDGLRVVSFQQITSLAASTALTVPAKAKAALITVTTQPVRVRFDGNAPTASVGHQIAVGDHLFVAGDLAGIRIIQTAASANVDVTYFA